MCGEYICIEGAAITCIDGFKYDVMLTLFYKNLKL
jgi:hypothetical protein